MDREMEIIAATQHEIWAHWMKYLFSVCAIMDDGSIIIPPDKAQKWLRQMNTNYIDLTEQEKESDRHQAEKVLNSLCFKNDHSPK